MKTDKTFRGFVAGLVLGVLLGSTGMAGAAIGYKAWSTLGRDFQMGYLTGFLDMANLARGVEPGGFIDERYPVWPQATLQDWLDAVNEIYANPEYQQTQGMYAVVQLAARDVLTKKLGPAPTTMERLAPKIQEAVDRARKAEADRRAAKAAMSPAEKAAEEAKRAERAKAIAEAKADEPPKKKRWCRCDSMPKAAESGSAPAAAPAAAPASAPPPPPPSPH